MRKKRVSVQAHSRGYPKKASGRSAPKRAGPKRAVRKMIAPKRATPKRVAPTSAQRYNKRVHNILGPEIERLKKLERATPKRVVAPTRVAPKKVVPTRSTKSTFVNTFKEDPNYVKKSYKIGFNLLTGKEKRDYVPAQSFEEFQAETKGMDPNVWTYAAWDKYEKSKYALTLHLKKHP